METTIVCTHVYRALAPNWTVLHIKFEGKYHSGTDGNEQAKAMQNAVQQILKDEPAKGVIVDVRELEYQWGNSISNVFRSIHSKKYPSVVLISEKSSGLDNDFMRMLTGQEFYYDEQHAIDDLESKLRRTA